MARFKIITPVPNWEGNVGERETGVPVTRFADGVAEIDVVDQGTASRLAYFRSAGYIIEPLDGVSESDAIRSSVLTVGQEAASLLAENEELRQVSELDKLRAENARLRERVAGRRSDSLASGEPTVTAPAGDDVTAPADNAGVDEWRAYAVARLGLSESEVKGWDKRGLQKREADRAAAAEIEGGGAR